MKKLILLLLFLLTSIFSETYQFSIDTSFTYSSQYHTKDKAHTYSIQRIQKNFAVQSITKFSKATKLAQKESSLLKTDIGYLVLSNKGFFSRFTIQKSEWKDKKHIISASVKCNPSIIPKALPLIKQLTDSIKAAKDRKNLPPAILSGYTVYLTFKNGTACIGHLYQEGGLYKQAITEYKRYIKEFPNKTLGYTNVANNFASLNNYTQSIVYYKKALNLALKDKPQKEKNTSMFYPNTKFEYWEMKVVELLINIAYAHENNNAPQKALSTYYNIINDYPPASYGKTIDDLLLLVLSKRIKTEYTKALEVALKNLELFPIKGKTNSNLQYRTTFDRLDFVNKLLIRSGKASELETLLNTYLPRIKDKANILNNCAWEIYLEKDSTQYEAAIKYASEAIDKDPSPSFFDTRGRLYYELKDSANAIRDLNQYISTATDENSKKYALENIEFVKKLGGTPAKLPGNSW